GVVEALLLPHTMRFNAPVTGAGLALIADALDNQSPAETGPAETTAEERAVTMVERFLASLAVPARLRDVDVPSAALADVADHAMDDWALTRVPRRVERPQLDELLHAGLVANPK
ncbi:MAG TPA: iron-containing alcohol dehydrogenase, partial [Trebonia sp.]|nr:iron-containing alcohol dehydrogenase [Trebonia sp.]